MAHETVAARFDALVEKTDGCWIWRGCRTSSGYGSFIWRSNPRRHSRDRIGAHRASWELAHGPIPDGLEVLHHCDNPPCVRPEHLFLGTTLDNARDRTQKGRGRGQFANGHPPLRRTPPGNAKLTMERAREIFRRFREGEPRAQIAAAFGVKVRAVYAIGRGETWRGAGPQSSE